MSTGSPFYENGLPRFKGEHNATGQMQGYWEFYRKDGSLMRSGSFESDQQVGEWNTFARDGRLVKTTDFGPAAG
jgi:antitoxin component YwqK of YwqJK toxin-antitoxin module